jgi:hypothetical protein
MNTIKIETTVTDNSNANSNGELKTKTTIDELFQQMQKADDKFSGQSFKPIELKKLEKAVIETAEKQKESIENMLNWKEVNGKDESTNFDDRMKLKKEFDKRSIEFYESGNGIGEWMINVYCPLFDMALNRIRLSAEVKRATEPINEIGELFYATNNKAKKDGFFKGIGSDEKKEVIDLMKDECTKFAKSLTDKLKAFDTELNDKAA